MERQQHGRVSEEEAAPTDGRGVDCFSHPLRMSFHRRSLVRRLGAGGEKAVCFGGKPPSWLSWDPNSDGLAVGAISQSCCLPSG